MSIERRLKKKRRDLEAQRDALLAKQRDLQAFIPSRLSSAIKQALKSQYYREAYLARQNTDKG